MEAALSRLDVAVDFRNAIVHGNETQVARGRRLRSHQPDADLVSPTPSSDLESGQYHGSGDGDEARRTASHPATVVRQMRKTEPELEYGEEVAFSCVESRRYMARSTTSTAHRAGGTSSSWSRPKSAAGCPPSGPRRSLPLEDVKRVAPAT